MFGFVLKLWIFTHKYKYVNIKHNGTNKQTMPTLQQVILKLYNAFFVFTLYVNSLGIRMKKISKSQKFTGCRSVQEGEHRTVLAKMLGKKMQCKAVSN